MLNDTFAYSADGKLLRSLIDTLSRFLAESPQPPHTERTRLETIHFLSTLAFINSAQSKIYHHSKGKVIAGPFSGMKFPPPRQLNTVHELLPTSGASFNIAKFLLGTYEHQLHEHVANLTAKNNYDVILVLGCGLGYYATGLAMLQPHSRVIACDTNASLHPHILELATLNNVKDRISIQENWTAEDFSKLKTSTSSRCLVLCDIEGDELSLLNPKISPVLLTFDLIVEAHDFLNSAASRTITDRFRHSHNITIVPSHSPPAAIPKEISTLTRHERSALYSDLRPGPTPWAVMTTN